MTEHRDLAREPCPDRIVEDLGMRVGCFISVCWFAVSSISLRVIDLVAVALPCGLLMFPNLI